MHHLPQSGHQPVQDLGYEPAQVTPWIEQHRAPGVPEQSVHSCPQYQSPLISTRHTPQSTSHMLHQYAPLLPYHQYPLDEEASTSHLRQFGPGYLQRGGQVHLQDGPHSPTRNVASAHGTWTGPSLSAPGPSNAPFAVHWDPSQQHHHILGRDSYPSMESPVSTIGPERRKPLNNAHRHQVNLPLYHRQRAGSAANSQPQQTVSPENTEDLKEDLNRSPTQMEP
jgi:hypothetical protein